MKNRYAEMQRKHQNEMDAFPLGACFSNKQFEEMMTKFGLTTADTDKIYNIGGGCYIRKSDSAAFDEMISRFDKELSDAIAADKTGDGFIFEMFYCELANHEYCITYEYDETLYSLDLTMDDILADKRLLHGLKKAEKQYLKNYKNA